MTRVRSAFALVVAALSVAVTATSPTAAQRPVFRSSVSGVLVPVTALMGRTPVRGLTAANFTLADQGVPQEFVLDAADAMPVDVTFLVDVSGSTAGSLDEIRAELPKLSEPLRPDDRSRILVFDRRVTELVPWHSGPTPRIGRLSSFGATSLIDALVTAVVQPQPVGRRRLVVVFTDGEDNNSTLGDAALMDVVLHADAVVNLVLSKPVPTDADDLAWRDPDQFARRRAVVAAAESTSGQTYATAELAKAFRTVLDDFRNSYLLRFTPTGVAASGWHALAVGATNVNGEPLTVHARKGYFGDR